ncbi:MAG TPA: hypothetical protein VFJ72_12940 [Rubrobacteraceae bacterium]|nr:hypothetical protein [Rubrobacteraceae bacterium]
MDERNLDRANKAARQMAEISRESYRAVVERAFAARESNERLTRSFFEEGLELFQDHAELNRRTLNRMAEQAQEHRDALLSLSRDSLTSYDDFVGSLSGFYDEVTGEREREE